MKKASPFPTFDLPIADAIVMTTASATYCLHPCGPLDAAPLSDFTDSHLHKDYFFRLSHWREKLADPAFQVYSLSELVHEQPDMLILQGIAITYRSSRLLNLYLAEEIRTLGIGSLLIEALQPDEIRCKTNMSQGDPTQWYVRQGYDVLQEKQGKNGTITILRRARHDSNNPNTHNDYHRPKMLSRNSEISTRAAAVAPLHPPLHDGGRRDRNGPPDRAPAATPEELLTAVPGDRECTADGLRRRDASNAPAVDEQRP